MNIKKLFDAVSASLNIDALRLEENSEVTLAFDDVIVSVQTSETDIIFLSKVADLPSVIDVAFDQAQEDFCEFLLKISNFGNLDVYVGLDPVQKCYTCTSKLYLYTVDAQKVISQLEKHINTVEAIRLALQEKDMMFVEKSAFPLTDQV